MRAIKKARKYISEHPEKQDAKTLAKLAVALQSNEEFPLHELYEMKLETFELALEVLSDWRLDRYYTGKERLVEVASGISSNDEHSGIIIAQ
ncbi:hypothetical protein GCM10007242_34200 [Pigmentiphaga litoralis]|jgi:hypothetical protein|uniref:hypothetical protein n=1 Tax=Pigmentiphaga litoralis TaxID=516702 RepID=UPI00167C18C1|nr:hypothetical protein [Pigmentiphaga litoralis]GGX23925.1 hypothetical protein GCM10007242_34200 [Pigmentiphaga litoralis]